MTRILNYVGSKWRLAQWINNLIPPHKVYLEPFFGSGAVFFNKPASHIETVNDINGDVINYFRTVRNRAEELAELISLTPYARAEYEESFNPADNDLERARKFAVRCWMGIGGKQTHKSGFRQSISPTGPKTTNAWNLLPEAIINASKRLKNAVIENKPAEEIIALYNDPQTIIYADPPYLLNTRKCGKQYKNEMTECEHESLLNCLKASKSKVIISGYESDMYNDILKDWIKYTKTTTDTSNKPCTEVLWLNYDTGIMKYAVDKPDGFICCAY